MIQKYQFIFRHLFYLKFVNKKLIQTWKIHQKLKHLQNYKLIKKSYILLDKMIYYSSSYLRFITV